MNQFLSQVAQFWCSKGNLQDRCFIFPNRRSLAFFQKYLSECISRASAGPVISPVMLTMNDFFFKLSGMLQESRVGLLLDLYQEYSKLNPKAESLDEFIFWGDILLSDFDDVDKYLVDPKHLFTNVADYKDIKDSYSYLTENQRNAILKFISHFKSGVDICSDNPNVKERFLQVWDILFPLYNNFNSSLSRKGVAYEGKAYRNLIERLDSSSVVDIVSNSFPQSHSFIFVGLNALNNCEKKMMGKLRDAGIAFFCWDWTEGWMKDPQNKSSHFMKDNIVLFPQTFHPVGSGGKHPNINVLSVPSSVGQAHKIPAILERLAAKNKKGLSSLGLDTAIVLPDENLLLPVLNSIPESIRDINVTMGFPMSSSMLYSLMNDIAELQMHMRNKDDSWFFYHKQVYSIFSSSIVKSSLSETGHELVKKIKNEASFYIKDDAFTGDPVLSSIFTPVLKSTQTADDEVIKQLGEYLRTVILKLIPSLKLNDNLSAELPFAKEYYSAIGRLMQNTLAVKPSTYIKLVKQIVSSVTVPFSGEPLSGLQIMGPLETRALDFKNIVILSSNENIFPRRSVSSSFIPPELRKGFEMPGYEYQDAVWAYYFYRMISRAEDVWLLYDSRTEAMKSGEESRYIKQLEYHFNANIKKYIVKAPLSVTDDEKAIEKTEEDIISLRMSSLSASSLQNYIVCPAKFYYHSVKKLKPEEDVAESLDGASFGNVFHNTMRALFFGGRAMDPSVSFDNSFISSHKPLRYITREYIQGWLNRPEDIRKRIESLIEEELHCFEVGGRNLVLAELVLNYVNKVLSYDLKKLKETASESFELIGLEIKKTWNYKGFDFVGFIDRMDSFGSASVRVVDYKTGTVLDSEESINDDNAQNVVDALFSRDSMERPKIALQLFLYDMFVMEDLKPGCTLYNTIYAPVKMYVKDPEDSPVNQKFIELMIERVSGLLDEMVDLSVPFERRGKEKDCMYCDFKNICGR